MTRVAPLERVAAALRRFRRRFEAPSAGGYGRVADLERENARLRRIVADRDLEIEMLRELSRGTY